MNESGEWHEGKRRGSALLRSLAVRVGSGLAAGRTLSLNRTTRLALPPPDMFDWTPLADQMDKLGDDVVALEKYVKAREPSPIIGELEQEVRSRGHQVEALQAVLESAGEKIDESLNHLYGLIKDLEAGIPDVIGRNIKENLKESLEKENLKEENLGRKLQELSAGIKGEMTEIAQHTLEIFAERLQSHLAGRIGSIEDTVSGQTGAIDELRGSHRGLEEELKDLRLTLKNLEERISKKDAPPAPQPAIAVRPPEPEPEPEPERRPEPEPAHAPAQTQVLPGATTSTSPLPASLRSALAARRAALVGAAHAAHAVPAAPAAVPAVPAAAAFAAAASASGAPAIIARTTKVSEDPLRKPASGVIRPVKTKASEPIRTPVPQSAFPMPAPIAAKAGEPPKRSIYRRAAVAGCVALISIAAGTIKISGFVGKPSHPGKPTATVRVVNQGAAKQAVAGTPVGESQASSPGEHSDLIDEATAATRRKDYDKAEEIYRSILRTSPNDAAVKRLLASVLFRQEKFEDSAKILASISQDN